MAQERLREALQGQGVTLEALALGDQLSADIKAKICPLVNELESKLAAIQDRFDGYRDPGAARLTLAQGAMAIGNNERAAHLFDEYTVRVDADWEVHFSRAVAHANARGGRESDLMALRAYNDALAIAPDSIASSLKARLYSYRGAILKRLARLDEAECNLQLTRAEIC